MDVGQFVAALADAGELMTLASASRTAADMCASISAGPGVYAPQHDSELLVDVLMGSMIMGASVLDLCTGSGVLAITSASLGAGQVTALDISSRAVQCARENAVKAGVDVDVRLGSLGDAERFGPYDVITCNPPYVPAEDHEMLGEDLRRAWDAGHDGRLLLDPLCRAAFSLLKPGGHMLLVHSEFSGTDKSLMTLRGSGLDADVVARQSVPFGPVMEERASWMEMTGRLEPGRRIEELVVIRADRPEL